jgi:DNA-damage-inducible protein D
MNRDLINELFTKFELAKNIIENVESWSARELQFHLRYSEWRNFVNVIDKAKTSCQNAGGVVADHFVDITKMVDLGSGAQRSVDDIVLSRYACYLIAQNGDPEKKMR